MRGRSTPSASRRASGVVRSMISTPSRWSVSCCAARRVVVELVAHVVAVLVFAGDRDVERPLDRDGDALDREAALVRDVGLVAALDDLRVDDGGDVVLVRLEHEDAAQDADLRRRKADAVRVEHRAASSARRGRAARRRTPRPAAPASSARRPGTGGSARAQGGVAPRSRDRAPRRSTGLRLLSLAAAMQWAHYQAMDPREAKAIMSQGAIRPETARDREERRVLEEELAAAR